MGYHLTCIRCGLLTEPALQYRCERCAGALEPQLALTTAAPRPLTDPELAYRDFLPVEPVSLGQTSTSRRTPCRPAPRLGSAIGVPRLWVKDESRQPTGTTKDRLAGPVLAVLRSFAVDEFVAASTGNTANALARAVLRCGSIRAHFFCGREFALAHRFRSGDQVRLRVVDGSYADASEQAQDFAARHGIHWEGGFFNWARREGLKVAYLEAFDAMNQAPDVVVQAVSSGMGVMAAAKGVREYRELTRLDRTPRFLMVQQDTCAPMATAWREGRRELTAAHVLARPTGIATEILLGDARPYYPYLAEIAAGSGGSIVSVSAADLLAAQRQVRTLEGLRVGASSAAAVAALRNEARAGRVGRDEVALVMLTGGIPPTHHPRQLSGPCD